MGRLKYIFIFLVSSLGFSQQLSLSDFPSERIEITTNSQVFTSGEDLFVNLYCFDTTHNSLSTLSQIVYVVIQNDSGVAIYEDKLKLSKGFASFTFFVPSFTESGNYKLIAYTKWMLNNANGRFAYKDLFIVNPYTKQVNSASSATATLFIKKDSIKQKIFKPCKLREKVEIDLAELQHIDDIDIHSIIISKKEDFRLKLDSIKKPISPRINKEIQLPEMRGELISGTVLNKDRQPVANVVVTLSIIHNKTIFKTSRTNSKGKYFFNLFENYRTGDLILKVRAKQKLTIVPDPNKVVIEDFTYYNLKIDKSLGKWVAEKSFFNQIENSYDAVKKDVINSNLDTLFFYGNSEKKYVLSDYKSFSTIKETFTEIVREAHIKKDSIYIPISKSKTILYQDNLAPLILIDGIPIDKHKTLLDLNIRSVEAISVINRIYQLGSSLYKGVLSVETKKGNHLIHDSKYYKPEKLKARYQHRQLFSPNYEKENNLHIPDFRTVLLWQTENIDSHLVFFTSDVSGVFEVKIEGLKNNIIVSESYYLYVH